MGIKKYRCAVCGKEFEKISAPHIKTHGLTRTEYMEQYGSDGVSTNNLKNLGIKTSDEFRIYVVERHHKIDKYIRVHDREKLRR